MQVRQVVGGQWPSWDAAEGLAGRGVGHETADLAHDGSGGEADQQHDDEQQEQDHEMIVPCLAMFQAVATSVCAAERSHPARRACWRSSTCLLYTSPSPRD